MIGTGGQSSTKIAATSQCADDLLAAFRRWEWVTAPITLYDEGIAGERPMRPI